MLVAVYLSCLLTTCLFCAVGLLSVVPMLPAVYLSTLCLLSVCLSCLHCLSVVHLSSLHCRFSICGVYDACCLSIYATCRLSTYAA